MQNIWKSFRLRESDGLTPIMLMIAQLLGLELAYRTSVHLYMGDLQLLPVATVQIILDKRGEVVEELASLHLRIEVSLDDFYRALSAAGDLPPVILEWLLGSRHKAVLICKSTDHGLCRYDFVPRDRGEEAKQSALAEMNYHKRVMEQSTFFLQRLETNIEM